MIANLKYPLAVLDGMLALLADPKRWTKGEFARDGHGGRVGSGSPEASCWCLLGAKSKVGDDLFAGRPGPAWLEAEMDVRFRLEELLPYPGGIPLFNDDLNTTHADVIKLLNAARDDVIKEMQS